MKEYIVKETADGLIEEEELIRCKDCKYSYKSFKAHTCQRTFHPFTIEDEGFCGWAERKEE